MNIFLSFFRKYKWKNVGIIVRKLRLIRFMANLNGTSYVYYTPEKYKYIYIYECRNLGKKFDRSENWSIFFNTPQQLPGNIPAAVRTSKEKRQAVNCKRLVGVEIVQAPLPAEVPGHAAVSRWQDTTLSPSFTLHICLSFSHFISLYLSSILWLISLHNQIDQRQFSLLFSPTR